MLTKAEAAARLGISESTLIRWVEHGLVTRHAYNAHAYLYEAVLCSQDGGVGVSPGHKLAGALCGSEIDEFRQHIGEPGLRIDAVEFAGLKKRLHTRPVFSALIVAGEQAILAIERNRAGLNAHRKRCSGTLAHAACGGLRRDFDFGGDGRLGVGLRPGQEFMIRPACQPFTSFSRTSAG